jgi:hypothetical protein
MAPALQANDVRARKLCCQPRDHGKRVQICENEAGHVTIHFQGRALRFGAFPKHGGAGVMPGDIVANSYLAGALSMIRDHQQQREAQPVAKLRTLRERAIAPRA